MKTSTNSRLSCWCDSIYCLNLQFSIWHFCTLKSCLQRQHNACHKTKKAYLFNSQCYFFSHHRRIIDEASDIAKVKFKFVASVYGLCSDASAVVMEYMSNGSLNNLLASHTLMWPKKFQMIHETSMGMNFLHSLKPPLLHLNLKTSNILLDDHLHVKVSDTW